jgi:hypothetical protein
MWSHGNRAVTGRVPRYDATSTPCCASAAVQLLVIERFVPAIEPRARAPHGLDHVRQPAIAAREDALDERDAAVVVLEPHAAIAIGVAQHLLLATDLVLGILRGPLQRRVRLGHVRADADRDLGLLAAQDAPPDLAACAARSRRCPRTSSSSSVGSPIMKYSLSRCQPRENTRRELSSMCASVTFLFTTSRMRWVPASGANVRPLMRVCASSSSRSSLRPYARSDATLIDTPRLRSSAASLT